MNTHALARTSPAELIGGVDTHADTHTLAILSAHGGVISTETFPATAAGYCEMITVLNDAGQVTTIGVEGTNSYGAGLTRALIQAGFTVKEVLRPTRRVRRMDGKSDPVDAIAAGRTILAGQGVSEAKDTTTPAEQIRFLLVARQRLIGAGTAIINSLRSLLVTAPQALRELYQGLSTPALIAALGACRPGAGATGVTGAAKYALKHLAQTYTNIQTRSEELKARMHTILTRYYPGLLAVYGVGTIVAAELVVTIGGNPDRVRSEAAFASLCGVAPIPASSGKTNRHRLNRGGDRRGNAALHRIVLIRMQRDERTRQYVARRTQEGKSTREIMRCLKRAVAREIYRVLTRPQTAQTSTTTSLRAIRQDRGLTLTDAANALETWPARISDIETGRRPLPALQQRYETWLKAS